VTRIYDNHIALRQRVSEQQAGFPDCVIAHELLHLRVPSHGRIFKALMTVHIPNWRTFDVARRTRKKLIGTAADTPWRCHSQIGLGHFK
jgi:predicted metal-dependent hydrolase